MSYFNHDLTKWEFETETEQRFKSKCKNLVEVYGEERLLLALRDEKTLTKLFTNSLINLDNVYFFLLKKFYLLNKDNSIINANISKLQFEKIQNNINNCYQTKALLFKLYFETLDIQPHALLLKKLSTTNYDKINNTLSCMQDFYQNDNKDTKKVKKYSIQPFTNIKV